MTIRPAFGLGSAVFSFREGRRETSRVRLDFAMVWASRARPSVHVDCGMAWGIVDVGTGKLTRSCLPRPWIEAAAEHWVRERRSGLLRRWAALGRGRRGSLPVIRRRNSPQLSRFSGMKVEMYWRDHASPHVHVKVGGETIVVDIRSATITEGRLASSPKRKLLRWVKDRQAELLANWDRAATMQPVQPIDPP